MKIDGLSVAVTGGAGFIGSHLVEQLLGRRSRVLVFDNFATGRRENLPAGEPRLQIVEGDVRDARALERALAGIDVVFHLATNCVRLSLTDPVTNHEVNATGTLNALLAAREAHVRRFVYCSSSEVYGDAQARDGGGGNGLLLREDSPKLPTTVYGASKLAGEHYTLAFHQTYGLAAMVVRPFNAYGPRAHFAGAYGEVIPRFAIWTRAGIPPVIFGDGRQTRDFTYVEDTASGLAQAAECDALLGDTVNLARGEEVSVGQLASMLCELNGTAVIPRHVADRPGDIRRLGADTTKAARLLGHFPYVPIREGLIRYLRWLDGQALDYPRLARALQEQNWAALAATGTYSAPSDS